MKQAEAGTSPPESRALAGRNATRGDGSPTALIDRVGIAALISLAPTSILYLAFSRGGYFPNTTGLAAIAFSAALVLRTTLAELPFEGFNRPLGLLLLSMAFFALWQLASSIWSHDVARSLDQYDRTLLYLLAFTLFGSLPRSSARVRWLIRLIAAAMTAVAVAGLVSRVLPQVLPTARSFYASRLSYPLSYWNAMGLMCALASLLLIHLTSSEDEHPITRVLAAAFLPATAAALLLTFSRAGLAIAIIAVAVYIMVGRPRGAIGSAVVLVPTAGVALHAAWAAQLLASNTPTSAAAVAQGHRVAIIVAICMAVAGCGRALMSRADAWLARSLGRRLPRMSLRAVLAMVAGGVTVALLTLVLTGVIARAWDEFAHGGGANPKVTRDRLADVYGEKRTVVWGVALHAFRSRPLLGHGAGTFELYYSEHRPISGNLTDAHELYLQTLAELGVVGFLALAVVLVGTLALLAQRIRGPGRATYAALFTAVLAWMLAAAVDWEWQMTAVTLWVFIVAGSSLASPAGPTGHPRTALPRLRTAMAVGWLVLAVAPMIIGVSYARLRASAQQFADGDCLSARHTAISSISLLPVRPDAYEILAFCDMELGFPTEGLQAAQEAARYEPENWNYQYGLALAKAANGLDPRTTAARALALNPRDPVVQSEVAAFKGVNRSGWERFAPTVLLAGLETGELSISSL